LLIFIHVHGESHKDRPFTKKAALFLKKIPVRINLHSPTLRLKMVSRNRWICSFSTLLSGIGADGRRKR